VLGIGRPARDHIRRPEGEVLIPPDQRLVGTRITLSCPLDELLFVQWSALHGLGLAPLTPVGAPRFRRGYCQRRSWPRSSQTREAVWGGAQTQHTRRRR